MPREMPNARKPEVTLERIQGLLDANNRQGNSIGRLKEERTNLLTLLAEIYQHREQKKEMSEQAWQYVHGVLKSGGYIGPDGKVVEL